MNYDPDQVIRSYTANAEWEDRSEKERSLRTEIPREYIQRYIRPSDLVLDAGGGAGVNAILMAEICESVTLVDLTPRMLELARENIDRAGVGGRVGILQGDISNLDSFADESFSFVVCVGDALSYVLDRRHQAISELVRVARRGATLILGADSRYGFLRLRLAEGKLKEAWEILRTHETYCGMGPRSYLYTVSEMRSLLEANGCRVLEVAATPSLSHTFDLAPFSQDDVWDELKALELEICAQPELLGVGEHLLFVAQKG